MHTIYELKEIMKDVENQYNTLLSTYNDEVKEDGQVHDDTVVKFNALFFQISNAYENLNKGLKGEF